MIAFYPYLIMIRFTIFWLRLSVAVHIERRPSRRAELRTVVMGMTRLIPTLRSLFAVRGARGMAASEIAREVLP